MGFAQHFFRNSNSSKNNFATAGISDETNRNLRKMVVQISPKPPHLHNFSHEILISAESAPNDVGRCCVNCLLEGGSA